MLLVKHIAACLLCLAMIVAGVNGLGHITRPAGDDVAFAGIQTFHDLPENSVDVIVYGSSHAWRNVNVNAMYDNYGIGAYNYACNWQHMNTTWLFFHDSLRTQSPKVVLIETFNINSSLFDRDMDGEIYYTNAIPDSPYKRVYLDGCFAGNFERYLGYYIPLVAYHENKNALNQDNFMLSCNTVDFQDTMGFYPRDGVFTADVRDWTQMEKWVLSDETIAMLDDIVETCREQGIEIVFFTAPWSGEDYHYFDAVQQYADENGCAYLNMFEHMEDAGITNEEDFCDPHHLNISGATKLANYLGAYLKEHYDLTDWRTIPGNQWEGHSNLEKYRVENQAE